MTLKKIIFYANNVYFNKDLTIGIVIFFLVDNDILSSLFMKLLITEYDLST